MYRIHEYSIYTVKWGGGRRCKPRTSGSMGLHLPLFCPDQADTLPTPGGARRILKEVPPPQGRGVWVLWAGGGCKALEPTPRGAVGVWECYSTPPGPKMPFSRRENWLGLQAPGLKTKPTPPKGEALQCTRHTPSPRRRLKTSLADHFRKETVASW